MELQGFTLTYWKCIGALVGFMIFWRIMSFLVLKLMIRKVAA